MKKSQNRQGIVVILLLLLALAFAGTLDCRDQQAVNEFSREYIVVTDHQGEPQLVPLQVARK